MGYRLTVEIFTPIDAAFLVLESREHPMHVSSLCLVDPPEGAEDYARTLHDQLTADLPIKSTFRRKPSRVLSNFAPIWWEYDDDLDIEYHVRLLALPRPGRIRELLELSSMLHGSLLDRHRPLWEVYVIDGLADGRVALFFKVHHAMFDGISAARMFFRALSKSPDDMTCVAPWFERPGHRRKPSGSSKSGPLKALSNIVAGATDTVKSAADIAPGLAAGAFRTLTRAGTHLPFDAPPTIFNQRITGARRFAAQSWSLSRIRAVGAAYDATINDIVLAMSGGALRKYLIELGELPSTPLVAMAPVGLKKDDAGAKSSGNSVGALLCELATDEADPVVRLRRTHDSMVAAKGVMAGLTPVQIMAISALNVGGLALQYIPGTTKLVSRPPFNIVISNVPGSDGPRWFNGARIDAWYPASIPLDGQAMNITVISADDELNFGIVGCRRTVPHLQYLLTYLEESLTELEVAAGLVDTDE